MQLKTEVKLADGHSGIIYSIIPGWVWCLNCGGWERQMAPKGLVSQAFSNS